MAPSSQATESRTLNVSRSRTGSSPLCKAASGREIWRRRQGKAREDPAREAAGKEKRRSMISGRETAPLGIGVLGERGRPHGPPRGCSGAESGVKPAGTPSSSSSLKRRSRPPRPGRVAHDREDRIHDVPRKRGGMADKEDEAAEEEEEEQRVL
ncbi:hypothetical protein BDY21DRAFT_376522, partial [Lineolata rhizophorae]